MKKIHIISLRVIALFVIAMLVSFIPEYLHDFFGDWTCKGSGVGKYFPADDNNYAHTVYNGCMYGGESHTSETHWGYRHWLFFMMGVILFFIQAFDIINYVDKK
jgi:hypothetical protein